MDLIHLNIFNLSFKINFLGRHAKLFKKHNENLNKTDYQSLKSHIVLTSIFDKVIDRRNTNSFKWDRYTDPNVIPAWVADMDFQAPQPILDAMSRISEHGVFGYSRCPDALYEVVIARLEKLHNWKIQKEWLVWLPGLVPGIGLSVRAFTTESQGVLTATPVYHPFMIETEAAGRIIQKVPMKQQNDRWVIDFEDFERAITPQTKLFLLCNPHNPGGTIFTKTELETLVAICLKHGIYICSDEIHCDLILDASKKHISLATLSPEAEQNSITLLAPSKTFNIAGLGCSFAVIPNDSLRAKFIQTKAGLMPMLSSYSYEAALAAYRDCADWHNELLAYLKANHDYLLAAIADMKGVEMLPLEATYLAWIDVRNTKIDNVAKRLEAAGVGINDGAMYDGHGFIRLNFACTQANLMAIVTRMKTVF
jgi:cysteine-S-conjugate beta-lyase